jgi:hypothetical protein
MSQPTLHAQDGMIYCPQGTIAMFVQDGALHVHADADAHPDDWAVAREHVLQVTGLGPVHCTELSVEDVDVFIVKIN